MTPRAPVESWTFREKSVSILGKSPGRVRDNRVMFTFLLGNRVPMGLGDSTHSTWQPVPGAVQGPIPHMKKQGEHSQDSAAGGPAGSLLSQEHMNVVGGGGTPTHHL